MKTAVPSVFMFLSLVSLSAEAGIWTCNAVLSEDIKVARIIYKWDQQRKVDLEDPIPQDLIIKKEILNPDFVGADLEKLHKGSSCAAGECVRLYTTSGDHPVQVFRFSDNLRLAKKNPNKGYEHESYMTLIDENGKPTKKQFYNWDRVAFDKAGGVEGNYDLGSVAVHDARSGEISVQAFLSKNVAVPNKTGFSAWGLSYAYIFDSKQKKTKTMAVVATGYHNNRDDNDFSSGSGKSDSLELTCTKQ